MSACWCVEVLECWYNGVLVCFVCECWCVGWCVGVLVCWFVGVLKCWCVEVLVYRSVGVLECVSVGVFVFVFVCQSVGV